LESRSPTLKSHDSESQSAVPQWQWSLPKSDSALTLLAADFDKYIKMGVCCCPRFDERCDH